LKILKGNAVNEYDVMMMLEPKASDMSLRKFSCRPQEIDIRFPVVIKTTLPPLEIELFNIPFDIRQGKEYLFLESRQWPSLKTHGKDAAEAITNMLSVIQEVTQEYVFVEESKLSDDALGFRRFLIQKLLV
jgi:hypothetical protein